MIVFGKLVCSAVLVSACLLLMRSYFTVQWPLIGKAIAAMAGNWAILCIVGVLGDHQFLHIALAALLAGLLCWYMGRFDAAKAVLFGAGFGLLRLTAYGAAVFIHTVFPGLCEEIFLLIETTVFYGLIALAAASSKQWRLVSAPMLQLLPIWLVEVVLCEEIIRNRSYESVSVLTFFAFAWMLYAGVMLVVIGSKMEDRVRQFFEKQQKAHHYALQEEYYQQLQDKQAETRALWHDLNKYLRAAKTETQSAQALEQLESMLNSATQIVDVGNRMLNVILNEYTQMAKATGIDLRLKVQVPAELPVSVADLYILIGNTMDNAMEACNSLPPDHRVIDLTLRTQNDVLYYKLVNPYSSEQPKREADPMHGHGLQNVRRCVEKYNGFIDVVKEKGFFTVTAHLNIDEA